MGRPSESSDQARVKATSKQQADRYLLVTRYLPRLLLLISSSETVVSSYWPLSLSQHHYQKDGCKGHSFAT